MNVSEYKSPAHKLIAFFKKSRDSWEEVAKKRREHIRDLNARIRDLETSRGNWKEKTQAAIEEIKIKEELLLSTQKALEESQAAQVLIRKECDEYKKKLKR